MISGSPSCWWPLLGLWNQIAGRPSMGRGIHWASSPVGPWCTAPTETTTSADQPRDRCHRHHCSGYSSDDPLLSLLVWVRVPGKQPYITLSLEWSWLTDQNLIDRREGEIFFPTFFFKLHFYLLCVYMCMYVPQHTYEGQRTSFRSQFFASTMWVLGLELGLSGLLTSTFTRWAIPPAWEAESMSDLTSSETFGNSLT